ncbi:hypothetical protein AUEXF2481DRAFT_461026 [Aureobasidium subglaciale EXF-2481]|uniref:DUF7730 domain-containing protein n=1 Tax=Aureobasidium subglaciale (strain EXF-2481) TaxID=1043005 RepID=A0A074Y6Z4_AURSE|nr:uncharacterized protein AUEXF2481DRAFT_461026 [Aureobasidium subglaciale EXF-2481]KEQ91724.1 hypothetical protein AUEXF2481DRAFT_461026 [Aureobasidium subglaciale EXF-2481]
MSSLLSLLGLRQSNDAPSPLKQLTSKKPYSVPGPSFALRRPLTPPGLPAAPYIARPQPQSPLLSLPVELRLHIWTLVVGPGRAVPLDYWKQAFESRNAAVVGLPLDDGDLTGWETGLLASCKQTYTEVLPMLLRAMKIKTRIPDVMIRLPQLLPPHRLHTIRNVEFLWFIHCPPAMDPNTKAGRKEKENALLLKAICELLGTLDGLEVFKWHFAFNRSGWEDVEQAILDEINKARKGRQDWEVIFYQHLSPGTGGKDWNGLTITYAI